LYGTSIHVLNLRNKQGASAAKCKILTGEQAIPTGKFKGQLYDSSDKMQVGL